MIHSCALIPCGEDRAKIFVEHTNGARKMTRVMDVIAARSIFEKLKRAMAKPDKNQPASQGQVDLSGVNTKLDQILANQKQIITLINNLSAQEQKMNADVQAAIADLTAKVAAEKTVEDSAVTLLNGLSVEIANLKAAAAGSTTTDPAVLQAIADLSNSVSSNASSLAAAVTANTPAAPAPTA